MPKGHPRCPDCHGAGGRMARRRGGPARWVRCKCVPNHIDDNTRRQALQRITEVLIHNDGDLVRLNLAVDVAKFCGITEAMCLDHLARSLPAMVYNGKEVEQKIKDHYSKDEDADTRGDASSSSTDSSSR